ncbi:hypothetical protein O181_007225 [Austropuccinia psidii MF-1]|uniref:Uncharacterized protein n=1 Tax=Austropuccinia psidii MF-1 TaxID=1389203 RepID=A0A9Q3BLZ0_9BASI|nr:hypothetical protein [Austropuccinia psidii MF-1]
MNYWGDWQTPSIQTGLEPLGYNYGLRKTKKRMENEEKKKQSAGSLPLKEIPKPIKSLEEGRFVKRRKGIPGGLIQNEDVDEGRVIITRKYKSKISLETYNHQEPILSKEKTPEKGNPEEFKAVVKSHKAEKPVKKSQSEE